MCATASAILHWNAIPVFADIEEDTFCISPDSIERNISPYTKAIISVDIGGHPANTEAINKIAIQTFFYRNIGRFLQICYVFF